MKTYSLLKALSLQLSLCTFASAFALPASPPLGLDVRDSGIDVVLPAGWAYLGCFTDQTDPQRTLSTQTGLYGLDVTIEVCIDTCIGLGFGYAGLESGFQCFCGDVTASPGTVVDAGCDIPCAGNDAELCGGALRLSVFVNQAVNPPVVSTTTSATSATTTTTTTSSSTTTTIETTSSTETTSSSSIIATTVTAQEAPVPTKHITKGGEKGGKGEAGKGGHAGKGGSGKGGHEGSTGKGGAGGGAGKGGSGGGAGKGSAGGHGSSGGKGGGKGKPPAN
ncbi:putative glyoxal oxidase-like protein [Eutypa lata UCREL1]|uniref:Putative glyoxal oxidase-like protein n=1 Tax=Eutypa lata (strain UCR-EL1) TaxID=1287681 RepID=M7TER8_EUTLA|nr:putative glyoxal oxidase-like protein [Eutypa lata UCREL1]